MQIHPEQGSLPPGETAICVLTFTAAAHPKCYQLDVICQVQNHNSAILLLRSHYLVALPPFWLQIIEETVLTQYHHALQHWEKEKQQHDFMATGRKLSTNTSEMVISQIPKQLWPHVKLPLVSSLFSLLQEANTTNTKRPTLRKYKVIWTL